jgi:hypothetical protein
MEPPGIGYKWMAIGMDSLLEIESAGKRHEKPK